MLVGATILVRVLVSGGWDRHRDSSRWNWICWCHVPLTLASFGRS